jgi:hypothetical protein
MRGDTFIFEEKITRVHVAPTDAAREFTRPACRTRSYEPCFVGMAR